MKSNAPILQKTAKRNIVGHSAKLSNILVFIYGKKSVFFLMRRTIQFVILNPLSYCFEEIIGFGGKASFLSRPMSRLIR